MKFLSKILIIIFISFSFLKAFEFHGSTKGFPKKAPEINGLITDEGETFSLEDLKGKVILITYGY
ncbi:MAG: SCO family protein, partial [Aquificae bacterium]|nr:SCO family protein [Aquificota bacterium]